MAIVKVAQSLLLLSVLVAVIHGYGLERYVREASQQPSEACTTTISDCDKCRNPRIECDTCLVNYIRSKDRQACIVCPINCKKCKEADDSTPTGRRAVCEECNTGHKKTADGNCVGCSSYCDQCETAGANYCDAGQCQQNYTLGDDKTCWSCASYCKRCSTAGKCDPGQCYDRFVYDSSSQTCKACPDYCKRCTNEDSGTMCIDNMCDERYVRNSTTGMCLACGGNCTRCSTVGKCDDDQCEKGTIYNPDDEKCLECPQYCSECELAESLTTTSGGTVTTAQCKDNMCVDGYGLNQQKQCDPCDTNCVRCTEADKCDENQCKPRYAYKSDETCEACPDKCKECTMKDDGTGTECQPTKCDDEYTLKESDKTCQRCPAYCRQCRETTNGLQCTRCKNRALMLDDQTCQVCPPNCHTCSQISGQIVCNKDSCDAGYGVEKDGQCAVCSQLTLVANCDNCTDADKTTNKATCTACATGFTISDDNKTCMDCSTTPLSCAGGTCIDRGDICSNCTQGFNITEDETACALQCYYCPLSTDGCNKDAKADQDTTVLCTTGCWDGDYTISGVTTKYRGCSNETCSPDKQGRSCSTVAGNTHCRHCCRTERCNSDGARIITSIVLLIIMAFVAIVM